MQRVLKSIPFYIFAPLSLAVATIVTLPIALLPQKYRYKSRFYHIVVNICARVILFFSFINYKINGNKNVSENNKPAIFIMNHSSSLDILVLELLLKSQPRIWITKTEYTKVPIWGFVLNRMHVALERFSVASARLAMSKIMDIAKKNDCHITLFPEGQRYIDGKIHPFFSGFAVMAENLDRQVIPIAVSGLNKVLPAKSLYLDPAAQVVKISIGTPICYKDFQSRQDFVDYTHKWFEIELEKLNTK